MAAKKTSTPGPGQPPVPPPLQAVPPQPPEQPQAPLSDSERIAALEERVGKLSQAMAKMMAAQITPQLQEQLEAKIAQELGG